jgi:hypothetical protein
MNSEIAEFSYLWDGSSPSWALLHINVDKPEEDPRYLIVDTETRSALLIRDDTTYAQVKEKMLEEGIPIVSFGNGFYL